MTTYCKNCAYEDSEDSKICGSRMQNKSVRKNFLRYLNSRIIGVILAFTVIIGQVYFSYYVVHPNETVSDRTGGTPIKVRKMLEFSGVSAEKNFSGKEICC